MQQGRLQNRGAVIGGSMGHAPEWAWQEQPPASQEQPPAWQGRQWDDLPRTQQYEHEEPEEEQVALPVVARPKAKGKSAGKAAAKPRAKAEGKAAGKAGARPRATAKGKAAGKAVARHQRRPAAKAKAEA